MPAGVGKSPEAYDTSRSPADEYGRRTRAEGRGGCCAPIDAGSEPPANEAVSAAADLLEVAWAPRPLRSVVQRRGAAGAERPGPTGVSGVSGCPAGVEEPLGGGELEGRGPDATSRPRTVSPSPAVLGTLNAAFDCGGRGSWRWRQGYSWRPSVFGPL